MQHPYWKITVWKRPWFTGRIWEEGGCTIFTNHHLNVCDKQNKYLAHV